MAAVSLAPAPRARLRPVDLVDIDREPRIPDLTLAGRLGYEKPHSVRKLIERNRDELAAHGLVVTRPSSFFHDGEKSRRTGRPGTAYLLNEGQALVVCALSRTPIAAKVRQDIIAVYMAHRTRNGSWSIPGQAAERAALREICERGHAYPCEQPITLEDPVTVATHVLVIPARAELLHALALFDDDDDLEDGGDDEPSMGWSAGNGSVGLNRLFAGYDGEAEDGFDREEDRADYEPPLGSIDDHPDQRCWSMFLSTHEEEPSLGAIEGDHIAGWSVPPGAYPSPNPDGEADGCVDGSSGL